MFNINVPFGSYGAISWYNFLYFADLKEISFLVVRETGRFKCMIVLEFMESSYTDKVVYMKVNDVVSKACRVYYFYGKGGGGI